LVGIYRVQISTWQYSRAGLRLGTGLQAAASVLQVVEDGKSILKLRD
jgi:hypothetical protein